MFWKKKRAAVVLEKYTFQLGDGDDILLTPPQDKYKQMWQQTKLVCSYIYHIEQRRRAILSI